jgi:16S rRNA U516 pseudouridylate synthase RsuA-like enzyme
LVKAKKEADSKAKENELKAIEEVTDKKLDKLHKKYLAKLSKELTPDQIEQVKDGMTYKVLPITYNGYLAMIPNLTENQKVYIKTQLTEAREHAMDAGTSEEKHKWFEKDMI